MKRTAVSGAAVDWFGAIGIPLPLGITPGITTTGPVLDVKVKSGLSITRQLVEGAAAVQAGAVGLGTTVPVWKLLSPLYAKLY